MTAWREAGTTEGRASGAWRLRLRRQRQDEGGLQQAPARRVPHGGPAARYLTGASLGTHHLRQDDANVVAHRMRIGQIDPHIVVMTAVPSNLST